MGFTDTYDTGKYKVVPKDAVVVNLTANPDYTANLIRRFTRDYGGGAILNCIAAQIEAQTKPARIPEPGLWGVVEASRNTTNGKRNEYVRGRNGWYDDDCIPLAWDYLIDPVLVRAGVES